MPEYKKTSMKTSLSIFESFLNGLGKENAARRLEKSGRYTGHKFYVDIHFI